MTPLFWVGSSTVEVVQPTQNEAAAFWAGSSTPAVVHPAQNEMDARR